MSSCVVTLHVSGLGSLLNKVLTCMDLYDQVHVDFSQKDKCMYEIPEGVNLWNCLFEPTAPPTGDFVELKEYPDFWMTCATVAKSYQGDESWRQRINKLWRERIRVRPEIVARAETYLKDAFNGREFWAIQVRAHSHFAEQISAKSQSHEMYEDEVRKVLPDNAPLYVAADNEDTPSWFGERFPEVHFFPETRRSKNRDTDFHHYNPQTIQDAINSLTEILIFSQARVLIHPVSNMATAALYINPDMQHVYLP